MTSISNLTRSIHDLALQVGGSDLEEIVARSPVATCVATTAEGALIVNQAAADLTGRPAAEIVGRRLIHVFVHPDDAASVGWVGRVVQSGRSVDVRHRLLTASGEVRHVRASIAPIMDGDVLRYAVAQYVDETQVVMAVDEARRQGDRLERFAASVAHDLRSPIANVATAAGLLAEAAADLGPEVLELIGLIESASHEATKVVDRTLAAALEARGDAESLDAVSVVDRVKALLGPELAEANGQIIVAGNARLVRVPEETLREVLLNLCENAVKYRAAADPRIVVELDQRAQVIRVIDNGRGMSADQRSRVFQRGFQADTLSPGAGLGMARVLELVTDLGGSIEVGVSSPGGCVFEIQLPGRIGAG